MPIDEDHCSMRMGLSSADLAVQTHAAEHALEDQLMPKGRQPSH